MTKQIDNENSFLSTQKRYELSEKGQIRKQKYYQTDSYRQAHKSAQIDYRRRKILARKAYFESIYGVNANLVALGVTSLQAEILKVYYGLGEGWEPVQIRAVAQKLNLPLKMCRDNLETAKSILNLQDKEPS